MNKAEEKSEVTIELLLIKKGQEWIFIPCQKRFGVQRECHQKTGTKVKWLRYINKRKGDIPSCENYRGIKSCQNTY